MLNNFLGKQYVLELFGCQTLKLDDLDEIKRLMLEAARIAEATIVGEFFHQFSPYGISGVVVIAESHLSIHIWPEHKYAAIDIFTCSIDMDCEAAAEYLSKQLEAQRTEFKLLERGVDFDKY